MKKFNQSFLLFSLIALFLSSCNSIKVYSDFDSDINFDNYQSFAFYKSGIDKVEISDIDKKRILKSIPNRIKHLDKMNFDTYPLECKK